MHQEDPQAPPTEGQIVPPEEQILPTGGGTMPPPEAEVEEPAPGEAAPEEEAPGAKRAPPDPAGAPAAQAQSLARENPMPIALAAAFVAGVVVGRIFSR
jgi:hypothetical protein